MNDDYEKFLKNTKYLKEKNPHYFFIEKETRDEILNATKTKIMKPLHENIVYLKENLSKINVKFEAELDLHGYTLIDAKVETINFILKCARLKLQNIIIITGRSTDEENLSIKEYMFSILKNHKINYLIKAINPIYNTFRESGSFHIQLKTFVNV